MKKLPWQTLGFLLVILLYGSSRFFILSQKHNWHYDDIVTKVAISGNAAQIAANMDSLARNNQPVDASSVLAIFQRFKPWNFTSVSQNLLKDGRHPPLYFWLTHAWCSLFGSKALFAWQILQDVLLLLLLGLTATRILQLRSFWLLPTLAVILVHPSIWESVWMWRHYHLLAILVLSWFLLLGSRELHYQKLLLIALITVLGLLTHYYFALAMGIGFFGYALFHKTKSSIHLLLTLTTATLFTILFFPSFFKVFLSSQTIVYNDGLSAGAFKLSLGTPLRLLFSQFPIRALPYAILVFVWPIYSFLAFQVILKTPISVRPLMFFGWCTPLVHVLLLHMHVLPKAILTENRYFTAIAPIILLGFAYWISYKYSRNKIARNGFMAASVLLVIMFVFLNVRYYHQKAKPISVVYSNLICVVQSPVVDLVHAARKVQGDAVLHPVYESDLVEKGSALFDKYHSSATILHWPHFTTEKHAKLFQGYSLEPLEGRADTWKIVKTHEQ